KHAGALLEDFGVVPDAQYRMTRRDQLGDNVDLIAEAVRLLITLSQTRAPPTLRITDISLRAGQLSLTLTTARLARVDLWVDNRPWQSVNVSDGTVVVAAPAALATPRRLKALGFASANAPEPVAMATVRI
ncbi:MAG: hypothetical protein ACT4QE_20580, partial [Anaerolineales bacterium]